MLITDHDDGGRCKKRVGHDHGADNNEDDDADDNDRCWCGDGVDKPRRGGGDGN